MKNSLLYLLFILSACKISDKPKELKGQVLENGSNKPVANAKVTLSSVHYTSRNSQYKMDMISAITDADGRYSINFDWDKHQEYCLTVTANDFFGEFGDNTKSEFKDKNPVFNIMLRPHAYVRVHFKASKGHPKVQVSFPESGQFECYYGKDSTILALMEGGITKKYHYDLYDKNYNWESTEWFELMIEPHDTVDHTIEY